MERLFNRLLKRKIIFIGIAILLINVLMSLLAPVISPYDPMTMNPMDRLEPPSTAHLFGTDNIGRDLFTRVTYGGRTTFLIGGSVVFAVMLIGTVLGVLAGYIRYLDNLIMRVLDGMMAFPPILLAIAIMAAWGAGVYNVILALGITYTPRIARIVRSTVLSAKEEGYAEAATALGAPNIRIMVRHILPNCVSPVVVQATFIFAYAVLNEAALSFLGAGVPPTIPTWGNILNEGRNAYQIAYWYMVFPGIFIVMLVFAINMVGDGLRDIFDPLTFRVSE